MSCRRKSGIIEEMMMSNMEGGGGETNSGGETGGEILDETKFMYDGWLLTLELTGNSVTRSYVWGLDLSGSMQGAGGIGGLLFQQNSGGTPTTSNTKWFSHDPQGNVTNLRNLNDDDRWAAIEYGPFGERLTGAGNLGQFKLRYSGKYFDEETGFNYFGYRYYNPSTGRWITTDPVAENGGLNLRAFLANRSSQHVDPLGLSPKVWTGSGINNWNSQTLSFEDYVSKRLGLTPEVAFVSKLGTMEDYWTGSFRWNRGKAADAGGKYVKGMGSEHILDFEATNYAFTRRAGEFGGDKCKPKKVKLFLIAPKTTTLPRPDATMCNVTVDIYWASDDVPNQGLGDPDDYDSWKPFAINGTLTHVVPQKTLGYKPEGEYWKHDLRAFIGTDGKVMDWVYQHPDAVQKAKSLMNSDADYVFIGHSQGTNILLHVLNQVCNKKGISANHDGAPQ